MDRAHPAGAQHQGARAPLNGSSSPVTHVASHHPCAIHIGLNALATLHPMTDSRGFAEFLCPTRSEHASAHTGYTRAQVDLIRDKKFNFAGCSASDLVSHYMLPSTMRCIYQVRPQSPGRRTDLVSLCLSVQTCLDWRRLASMTL